MMKNHLTRASYFIDVRTGSKPGGVLKRVIRFKSCEKSNNQPDYLSVPVGLLARLLFLPSRPSITSAAVKATGKISFSFACWLPT